LAADLRDRFFTAIPFADVNTGAFITYGQQSAPAANALLSVPEGIGLAFTKVAATATLIGQHYTTTENFITVSVGTAALTAGEAKIMIEYIHV
jgi:hypothetical protein